MKEYLRQLVLDGRVDLVCHSTGGLVARLYPQELDGARRVDHCITLRTSYQGTYNAYWVASRVGKELRPDSAHLHRLKLSQSNALRARFTSIVAGSDNIVIPLVFSANEETIRVPVIGHFGMTFSSAAFRIVATPLEL